MNQVRRAGDAFETIDTLTILGRQFHQLLSRIHSLCRDMNNRITKEVQPCFPVACQTDFIQEGDEVLILPPAYGG